MSDTMLNSHTLITKPSTVKIYIHVHFLYSHKYEKNNKNIKSLKKKSDTNFLYAERPAKLRSITNENMTAHQ